MIEEMAQVASSKGYKSNSPIAVDIGYQQDRVK